MMLTVQQVTAQIPRNSAGTFEYSRVVPEDTTSIDLLRERAKTFFNQPFLVHWTSVSNNEGNGEYVTGKGYVTIRFKNHYSSKRAIPVLLQLSIRVKEGSFQYTINQLTVDQKDTISFPLEEKPGEVEGATYDRLLKKTHEQIIFVIDWLKRHMEDDRGI